VYISRVEHNWIDESECHLLHYLHLEKFNNVTIYERFKKTYYYSILKLIHFIWSWSFLKRSVAIKYVRVLECLEYNWIVWFMSIRPTKQHYHWSSLKGKKWTSIDLISIVKPIHMQSVKPAIYFWWENHLVTTRCHWLLCNPLKLWLLCNPLKLLYS